MHTLPTTSASVPGPRPQHPLADARRHGAPIAVIILIGWLSRIGWTAEQVVALLLVLLPGVAVAEGAA